MPQLSYWFPLIGPRNAYRSWARRIAAHSRIAVVRIITKVDRLAFFLKKMCSLKMLPNKIRNRTTAMAPRFFGMRGWENTGVDVG